jgi:DNA gyrase subunit A
MNRTKRTGPLVTIKGVYEGNDLMVITENGIMIRTSVDDISTMGRNTQGVRVINLKEGDSIADVTRVVTEEDEEATAEGVSAQAATNGQAVEAE